jgi:hypothetical protein
MRVIRGIRVIRVIRVIRGGRIWGLYQASDVLLVGWLFPCNIHFLQCSGCNDRHRVISVLTLLFFSGLAIFSVCYKLRVLRENLPDDFNMEF